MPGDSLGKLIGVGLIIMTLIALSLIATIGST